MSLEASQTHTQVFKTIYPFFDNDHFLTVQRSISYELQDNNVHFRQQRAFQHKQGANQSQKNAETNMGQALNRNY